MENNVAAFIPNSLMKPRKKLLVPRKTPAIKLGKIKNFSGLSLVISVWFLSYYFTAFLTFKAFAIASLIFTSVALRLGFSLYDPIRLSLSNLKILFSSRLPGT